MASLTSGVALLMVLALAKLRGVGLGAVSQRKRRAIANLLRQNGDLPGAIHHYQRTLEIDLTHGGAKRALESLDGPISD